ncbi:twin-arginine translocation signal domain-containing protein [Rothia kristinae]|uniref:glycoside hydrolase family 16 protein n=1 Tax=Rothia kristinae TaxID=37923 RepID=UPI0018CA243B|nr:glycoside hydrolase family 16 protein [Rothia kristinae]
MDQAITRRRALGYGGAGVAAALLGSAAWAPPAEAAGTYRSGWGNAVFEDDFSGSSLSSSRWNVRDRTYLSHDWSTISAANVAVAAGALKLTARKLASPVTTSDGRRREWSGAEVNTLGKFSLEHGRWEVRAKMPAAPNRSVGLWAAVWLRPDDGSVPGEVDIVETYGSKSSQAKTKFDPTSRAETTVHFNQRRTGSLHGWSPSGTDIYSRWNTWAVEKTPAGVRGFFNGEKILDVPSGTAAYRAAFPAGKKLNLRISFQVGNSYWGRPTAATASGQSIELDYVRVWKHQG